MEILILLVAVIAVSLLIKHKYPESPAAQLINSTYDLSLSLFKKGYSSKLGETATTSDNSTLTNSHQQEQAKEETISVELPLTSTVESKISEPAKFINQIPEDSVLKRHYFSQLESERQSITNPYPTDSTLRRHYESHIQYQL
jgi:hypothetical protein